MAGIAFTPAQSPLRAIARTNAPGLPWALIVVIAFADCKVDDRVPLGWLYLLPVSMLAGRLGRWGILAVALLCTALAESFDGFAWQLRSGLPREVLYYSAFAGIGLFVHQTITGRRAAVAHLEALESEMRARREAEEQLQILVESTPVAVFVADVAGTVLLANNAAERLFALPPGALTGRSVAEFIPPLLDVPALRTGAQSSFRTVMQCRAHRASGEIFQADVWFSTYRTAGGPRLAALVADTSDALRDREESSLDQLLAGSRILVGAVSHEVRNVCAAIQVVYANLARAETCAASRPGSGPVSGPGSGPDPKSDREASLGAESPLAPVRSTSSLVQNHNLVHNKDFEALGTLVVALERIASMELSQAANQLAYIDLHSLLEEVLIVIAPALREQEITLVWKVAPPLPAVWADRQSLMQVFLNLVKNSERAMEELEPDQPRVLTIAARPPQPAASQTSGRIQIHVADTGSGVRHPELLFKPFQQQASATGLGLYLSRALMRSFSGELRYDGPGCGSSNDKEGSVTGYGFAAGAGLAAGACFVVELTARMDDPSELPASKISGSRYDETQEAKSDSDFTPSTHAVATAGAAL